MIMELLMFAVGVGMYVRATRARDRIGRYALLAYVLVLLAAYVSDRFSDPPSSVEQVVRFGILAELTLLPWAWWFDRHREPSPAGQPLVVVNARGAAVDHDP
jgi:hypothetical protein